MELSVLPPPGMAPTGTGVVLGPPLGEKQKYKVE